MAAASVLLLVVLPLFFNTVPAQNQAIKYIKGVGIYVYKTPTSTSFDSYIKTFIDPGTSTTGGDLYNGAHYYVHAPYSHEYRQVDGFIILPLGADVYLGNRPTTEQRYAEFCLAVLTNKGGVDLGIQRQPGQAGWNAFNYPSSTASGQGKLIADSRGVHHVYFRVSTGTGGPIAGCAGPTCDIVKATFSYRNSADVQIDYDERVYAKPSPTFFDRDANGRLKLRFLRFMSLLPNGGASSASRDIADGAYITNARFTQLRLWNAAATTPNWVPWNAARIEHAWSVQIKNILSLKISNLDPSKGTSEDNDAFTSKQQVWYGARCLRVKNTCNTRSTLYYSAGEMDFPYQGYKWRMTDGWYTQNSPLWCVTSHSYPDANWTPPQYLYLNLDGIPVTNAAASSWCMNDYYSFQVLDRRTYYKDIERGLSASTCPGLGAYYQSMNMYQISFGPGSVNPLMQVSVPCSGGGSVSTASASIDNWDTHAHATVSAIEEPTWTGIENYINPSSAAVQRRSHTIPSLIPNSVLVRFPRARRSPAAAPMRRTWQASTLAAAAPSLAVTGVVAQDEPPLLESHTAAMQMEATNEVVRLDISADSGDVMSGAVALNPDDDGSGNGAEAATQEATAHAP